MRLLLDTHTLLWAAHEPEKLSDIARDVVSDGNNDVFASAVSAMEIATKYRRGKLEYETALAGRYVAEVTGRGFVPLSITCQHADRAGALSGGHKDPWDRLLAAQSQLEDMVLVTRDAKIAAFGVNTIW